MAFVEVTISELQSAASTISQANEEFLEAVEAMKSAVEALNASWEGPAHDAFNDEQQQMDRWYRAMSDVVSTYVEQINTTARTYAQMDATGKQIVQRG